MTKAKPRSEMEVEVMRMKSGELVKILLVPRLIVWDIVSAFKN